VHAQGTKDVSKRRRMKSQETKVRAYVVSHTAEHLQV
jgi:hypothetical protein